MSRPAAATLLALLAGTPTWAEVRLEVGGSVAVTAEAVEATVEVTNRGTTDASLLEVTGDLAGRHDQAALGAGVPGGATRRLLLRFPGPAPRPGVHAVGLRLDYDWQPVGGARSSSSQRAYLLVSLGDAPARAALRVEADDASIDDAAELTVRVTSADGAAHRARVRGLFPRGLNPRVPHQDVEVPAAGGAIVRVPLLRGGAPRPSRQGVLVVASTLDGEHESTAVATAVVEVAPDRWWMDAARPLVVGAGAGLLAAAAWLEWRARRPPRPA